ncbi:unnamed protein product [Spirodela intermedia]|uniref:Uncharacterized protein n=1 Tax=Spirodela intermedia TaxID=51605 RepID=A0ABN7EBV2_SPIIN|nr:unnamed protein product [Spirodela intermedia]
MFLFILSYISSLLLQLKISYNFNFLQL